MSDEYQIRKDIDWIISRLYGSENGESGFVLRDEFNEVISNYYDQGKIDEIVADIISGDIDLTDYIKKSDTQGLVKNDGTIDSTQYQELLESGTTIKTINNIPLLGSGDIHIEGSGGSILEPYLVPKSEDNRGLLCFDESSQLTFDDIYPVGAIYMSVNSTNPSNLFGGTWVQIKDTFLLSCGDNYSNGDTGGNADAVVVAHNHTQKSHNHTQNAHNHSPNSHSFVQSNKDIAVNGNPRSAPSQSSGGWHYVYVSDANSSGASISISSTTANKTATNQPTTAENNATGESGTGKNMPPYLAVYVWKRTA